MSAPRLSYRTLLREERDFRKLWLGDVASFFGDWFNLIALYTAVQAITDAAIALAVVVLVKTVPNFLVMPLTGPIVDRFDRRRLLILSDLGRAACVPGLIWSHHADSLAGLYGFTFTMVCFTGLAFPSKRAALPMVVARERISIANALAGGTWSVMLALGSAAGGAAVQWFGVTASFALDGLTFLISAALFAALPPLPAPARAAEDDTSFREGLRYLHRTPAVLAVLCCKPFMAFASSVMVTIPLWGTVAFPGRSGPLWVGLLYASRGAGAAIGSLVMRAWLGDEPRTLRRLILFGFLLVCAALTVVAHAPAYELVAFGLFLAALGSGGNWVFTGTLLQLDGAPSYLGRIFSIEFGLTTLILGGAGLVVGGALDWGMTLSEVTQVCAIVTLPPAVFWIVSLAYMRRQARQSPPEDATLPPPWAAESQTG